VFFSLPIDLNLAQGSRFIRLFVDSAHNATLIYTASARRAHRCASVYVWVQIGFVLNRNKCCPLGLAPGDVTPDIYSAYK